LNIFALSDDVNEIAKWQMDKHCVKMPLESAMMLSTAHRILDGQPITVTTKSGRNKKHWSLDDERENILYKVTHTNHPSTVWTRQSNENYIWHYQLFVAMLNEYSYRYGKNHACWALEPYLAHAPKNISNAPFTYPALAMPDECKIEGEVVQSYRNYYMKKKQHIASWKGKVNGRPKPTWFEMA